MKPAICEKHGIQNFILTSFDFSLAIEDGKSIDLSDIRKIKTLSSGKISEKIVGRKFFCRFFKEPGELEILLLDREKSLKKMNDRLLLIKIFSDPELRLVCPICLRQLFDRSN